MADSNAGWKRCSNCKNEIGFGQVYWVCSVSTCNRKRTGLVFCTTSCWDAHLPLMRHREAWAVEERAPTQAAYQQEQAAEASASTPKPKSDKPREPRRIIVSDKPRPSVPDADFPEEILVVASKLKKYVKARWGMNTSDAVMEVLSDKLRGLCDRAIRNAAADERKTLMKRDFDR